MAKGIFSFFSRKKNTKAQQSEKQEPVAKSAEDTSESEELLKKEPLADNHEQSVSQAVAAEETKAASEAETESAAAEDKSNEQPEKNITVTEKVIPEQPVTSSEAENSETVNETGSKAVLETDQKSPEAVTEKNDDAEIKAVEETALKTVSEIVKQEEQSDTKELNKETADETAIKGTDLKETAEQLSEDQEKISSENNSEVSAKEEKESDIKVENLNKDSENQKVKQSFFEKLKKTRRNLSFGLSALIKGKKIDDDLYEDLETSLLTADLGVETTQKVIENLKEASKAWELHDAEALKDKLKEQLTAILKPCEANLNIEKKDGRPYVILMVGVNGSGKTTTIGKLVEKFKAKNLKVMLAAGDTFRAAAVEQLKEWGKRTGVPVVAQPTGSDSASVIFDAVNSAIAHKADVLICDTAGRLQNKSNLMSELEKIVRVMRKIDDTLPDETMLVLDSTTGQNAVSQMQIFNQTVKITGITLTKLDGTAKGGVIFSLADKYKVPVRYVGIGEKVEDLRDFNAEMFIDALIDTE